MIYAHLDLRKFQQFHPQTPTMLIFTLRGLYTFSMDSTCQEQGSGGVYIYEFWLGVGVSIRGGRLIIPGMNVSNQYRGSSNKNSPFPHVCSHFSTALPSILPSNYQATTYTCLLWPNHTLSMRLECVYYPHPSLQPNHRSLVPDL